MSYLDRLKAKISERDAEPIATKATKGAFVPFVAPCSTPSRQISAANDGELLPIPVEIRQLIDRVMKLRACPESDREAFAEDWRAEPDAAEAALRHLADYYGRLQ